MCDLCAAELSVQLVTKVQCDEAQITKKLGLGATRLLDSSRIDRKWPLERKTTKQIKHSQAILGSTGKNALFFVRQGESLYQ